jgi:hypothetical protein
MACACQPVNDVGEPCAGEPHARFDAAAGGNLGPVGYAVRCQDASRRPYKALICLMIALRLDPSERVIASATNQASGRKAPWGCLRAMTE